MKYPVTSNYTVFYHVVVTNNFQNLKFYQRSLKTVIDEMIFALKLSFLHKKLYSSFHYFLIVQTPLKLRNSQIYKDCQLWYNRNYFSFFKKACIEIHTVRKIFPKYMDPVTSTGWEKNFFTTCFCLFLKWRYFSDISIK